jgi:acyl carrier protein
MTPAGEESVRRVQALMEDLLAIRPDDIDEDLIESGLLDSLGLVELLHAIEQDFTLELPLDDLDVGRLRSVRSIALYVTELLALVTG